MVILECNADSLSSIHSNAVYFLSILDESVTKIVRKQMGQSDSNDG